MNNKIKVIGIGTAIFTFVGAVAYATAKAATRKVADLAESVRENLNDMFSIHTSLLEGCAAANIMLLGTSHTADNLYKVEINRVENEITNGNDITWSNYDTILGVYENSGTEDFFISPNKYVIREINGKHCVLPKQEHEEMKTLPLDKLNLFFEEAKNSGVYEMYLTKIATGLRRGELLGLKWNDIDYDNQTIFVRRQICRIDGIVTEGPLKTKNSYRKIIVPSYVLEVLKNKQLN